jgi:triosephosphate isomerase
MQEDIHQATAKKLIVANWKMNGNLEKVVHDITCYTNNPSTNNHNVVFALPFLYLISAKHLLLNVNAKCKLASQDISTFNNYGAYTGEISGSMLQEIGISYSIIGHSERRLLYAESQEVLLKKLENAVASNITPIYCIGETLDIRNTKRYCEFLKQELDILFKLQNPFHSIIIAYEPIWAIGTGVTPNIQEISEITDLIYAFMQNYSPHAKITALYGGSVSDSNIKEILDIPQIGGVLVGGASLNTKSFIQICNYSY